MSKKVYGRIITPPSGSFFLFGARGVGKTTWARQQYGHGRRINLLDEGLYQDLLANPALFAGMLNTRASLRYAGGSLGGHLGGGRRDSAHSESA